MAKKLKKFLKKAGKAAAVSLAALYGATKLLKGAKEQLMHQETQQPQLKNY